MRIWTFTKRCGQEILRDPLNLAFGLGFPVVLLLLLSAIQANVPVALFEIQSLAPGVTVFGLAFTTLFSATLLAKDRESAFLQRLYATPLTAQEFILGYMLPVLPMALVQSAVCYLLGMALGLSWTAGIVYALAGVLPIAVFYVALGLLCGCVFNVKQVGGVCGALLTNLSAWLSGVWFDLSLVGGVFEKIANILPFVHAVEMERALLLGDFSAVLPHFLVVSGYAVAMLAIAVVVAARRLGKER